MTDTNKSRLDELIRKAKMEIRWRWFNELSVEAQKELRKLGIAPDLDTGETVIRRTCGSFTAR